MTESNYRIRGGTGTWDAVIGREVDTLGPKQWW